jgi:hypothetical protein
LNKEPGEHNAAINSGYLDVVSSTILLRRQRKPTGPTIYPDQPNPVCLKPAERCSSL